MTSGSSAAIIRAVCCEFDPPAMPRLWSGSGSSNTFFGGSASEVGVRDVRERKESSNGSVLRKARSAVGQLLRAEGTEFAALERLGNARAVVFEGACAADGPAGRRIVDGRWELRGYNV